jgi:hypothetical protein
MQPQPSLFRVEPLRNDANTDIVSPLSHKVEHRRLFSSKPLPLDLLKYTFKNWKGLFPSLLELEVIKVLVEIILKFEAECFF